ncbi:MAG: cyanophycinase [Longimicrobiales bacterium]
MAGTRGRNIALLLAALLAAGPGEAAAQACTRPCVGPTRGAVLAAGGGDLGAAIFDRFLELAGGADARIVLIPTAGAEDGSHDAWTALEALRDAGATSIEVLHTRNRNVADLEAFSGPLHDATGVWISGGRQWRLTDVYLHTRVHEALHALLARGGVIAGNSAGASVLASYLVRGSEKGNAVLVDPDADEGFGFLRNVAIDQHLLARGREMDMLQVLAGEPTLLGIGLDEGAAVVVTRDLAEVIGNARVAFYDVTDPLSLIPIRWLSPGEVYDLGSRQVILAGPDGG